MGVIVSVQQSQHPALLGLTMHSTALFFLLVFACADAMAEHSEVSSCRGSSTTDSQGSLGGKASCTPAAAAAAASSSGGWQQQQQQQQQQQGCQWQQ
jgi:hypothetical protein